MRRRTLSLLAFASVTAGCWRVYHPDLHEVISRTYVQNITYPVTRLRTLSTEPDAPEIDAGARQRGPVLAKSPRESAPPPVKLDPLSISPASAPLKRYFSTSRTSNEDELRANVTATRMGIPLPPRPESCSLGLFHTAFVDRSDYEQIGIVQISRIPIDTDPMSTRVRAIVREHACGLGGSYVALTSSTTIAPPSTPAMASVFLTYSVYADKPSDNATTLF
jgi:hypothetical protein